jgi:hypothetical protein
MPQMTTQVIAVAFICGLACAITANLVVFEMVARVNEKLPEERGLSALLELFHKGAPIRLLPHSCDAEDLFPYSFACANGICENNCRSTIMHCFRSN